MPATPLARWTLPCVRQQGDFAVLIDPGRRRAFRDGLNALMRRLDYTVIACAIRKDAHLAAYGPAALDPYTLSLNVLVERFCLRERGTAYLRPGAIRDRIAHTRKVDLIQETHAAAPEWGYDSPPPERMCPTRRGPEPRGRRARVRARAVERGFAWVLVGVGSRASSQCWRCCW
jgi:hypothetical protein